MELLLHVLKFRYRDWLEVISMCPNCVFVFVHWHFVGFADWHWLFFTRRCLEGWGEVWQEDTCSSGECDRQPNICFNKILSYSFNKQQRMYSFRLRYVSIRFWFWWWSHCFWYDDGRWLWRGESFHNKVYQHKACACYSWYDLICIVRLLH